MIQPINRIADHFNPDGSVKAPGLVKQPEAMSVNPADLVQARAPETANVNAQSAAASTKELHQAVVPVSPEVFLQEFRAAVQASPQNKFDGKVYDPREQALLAKLSSLVDAKEAVINLNLSDNPGAQAVLEKVQQGLGAIPPEYKALVTETVVKALRDNPGARVAFENLIRYAKASTAILAEAKTANLSAEDTVKLTNLLQQVQPFEGIFGALVANAFDAAKNLDVKSLVGIFQDYVTSLDAIVDPLVAKHMPKELSSDPLQVSAQVQAPIQNMLSEYAAELAPVAQQVMDETLGFVKANAGPLAKVAANAFAALSAFVKSLRPTPVAQLSDMLGISNEQAAKASLN